jgi:hypothetical protein
LTGQLAVLAYWSVPAQLAARLQLWVRNITKPGSCSSIGVTWQHCCSCQHYICRCAERARVVAGGWHASCSCACWLPGGVGRSR